MTIRLRGVVPAFVHFILRDGKVTLCSEFSGAPRSLSYGVLSTNKYHLADEFLHQRHAAGLLGLLLNVTSVSEPR